MPFSAIGSRALLETNTDVTVRVRGQPGDHALVVGHAVIRARLGRRGLRERERAVRTRELDHAPAAGLRERVHPGPPVPGVRVADQRDGRQRHVRAVRARVGEVAARAGDVRRDQRLVGRRRDALAVVHARLLGVPRGRAGARFWRSVGCAGEQRQHDDREGYAAITCSAGTSARPSCCRARARDAAVDLGRDRGARSHGRRTCGPWRCSGPSTLVLVRHLWNASATLEASLQLTLVAFSDVK